VPTGAITLAPDLASVEEAESANISAPLSILVAEDDEGQRKQLCAILQDLGFHDIEEAADWRGAADKGIARQFDLALIDLEMPAGNGQAGLLAATEIHQHRPDTKIALVTGNRPPWERREKAPEGLCGLIPKPFSLEQISTAMRRFLDLGDVGWPEDRRIGAPAPDPQGMQFIESISRAARVARPLREILTEMLQQLKTETGACAAAVFSWNRQNKRVSLEASVQIADGEFERCRLNLNRSPVTDLVYQPEQPIFFNNIDDEAEGKFLYLRPLLGAKTSWVMQACIGEVIADEGETVETLFVFGDRVGQFRSEHQLLTRATGAVLAAVLREHWIIKQVVAERRLTTLGGVLTSATHELKGRLSALEAVNAVARSWRKLRSHPESMQDEKLLQEIDKRIQDFTVAKKAMDTVVARILGWTSASVIEPVDLRARLDNAVQACALEARKSNVVVIKAFEYLPSVMGNPIELEQAFLNLTLNAIHHIRGTRRKSGVLRIETRQVVGTERPVQIRFRDTGPGIHSRYLDTTTWGEERIFQPLFTTKRAGTGMGLYITRGLLANHGGTVRVEETAILAGTTFLVELPLRGAS
jgi:signal transduction histidine kinase/CheY-like chemotaxis protein